MSARGVPETMSTPPARSASRNGFALNAVMARVSPFTTCPASSPVTLTRVSVEQFNAGAATAPFTATFPPEQEKDTVAAPVTVTLTTLPAVVALTAAPAGAAGATTMPVPTRAATPAAARRRSRR